MADDHDAPPPLARELEDELVRIPPRGELAADLDRAGRSRAACGRVRLDARVELRHGRDDLRRLERTDERARDNRERRLVLLLERAGDTPYPVPTGGRQRAVCVASRRRVIFRGPVTHDVELHSGGHPNVRTAALDIPSWRMRPETRFASGDVVGGKYVVEGLLGQGGMGSVFAARRVALEDRVAIKILLEDAAKDPEAVARFLREGRAAARIRGEHVARVLDVGSIEDGTPFLVMEYLEGSDLGSVVERSGPLSVQVAVDYVMQACEALAEAHAQGIVHRDIKPSNLFLTRRPDGSATVKVLDFGISKLVSAVDESRPDFGLTQTQTVMGSPQYMAPEQMRSSRRVDARTDIWAVGALFHELLTGRPPFESQSMPELFAMILQDPAPALASRRADIPPALDAVVLRCLEKDPAKRPASILELTQAIAPFGTAPAASVLVRIAGLSAQGGVPGAPTTQPALPASSPSLPAAGVARTGPSAPEAERTLVDGRGRKPLVLALGVLLLAGLAGVAMILLALRANARRNADAATTVPTAASGTVTTEATTEPAAVTAEPTAPIATTTTSTPAPRPSTVAGAKPPVFVAAPAKSAAPKPSSSAAPVKPARPEPPVEPAATATARPTPATTASSRYD